jgi:sec-independent protein translocase protein TatB
VFNISGTELVVILVIALVVLGPDKLPDAMRRAGKAYAELRKMTNTFQTEMRSALDEPVREMRETADLLRQSAQFQDDGSPTTSAVTSETVADGVAVEPAAGDLPASEHGEDGTTAS